MWVLDRFLIGVGAFLGGVLAVSVFHLPQGILYVASLTLGVGGALSFQYPRARTFAVVSLLFCIGFIRAAHGPISFAFFDPARRVLESVGQSFGAQILRALPEPHASYLAGIVIGAQSAIPYSLKEAFRKTGTAHLIALSGYNVSVVVEYMGFITRSLWWSLFGVFFFVLATGASSSVVRAALMAGLVFLARHYGYEYGARNALLAAVVVMVFFNPSILTGDISFQLSVAATGGLIAFSRMLEKRLYFIPKKFQLRESLATTLAAQVATFPIIFYYFGGYSVWSPLVNALILGSIPLTMLLGFLVGIVGYIHPYLAVIVGWPAYLLLSYQLFIIRFFAAFHVG